MQPLAGPSFVRRPVRARGTTWARDVAGALTKLGTPPNAISAMNVVFASSAGILLLAASHRSASRAAILYAAAAVSIALRLLCSLFDGMVAIEGGGWTRSGAVWNDLPDRLSDPIVLVCAGYSIADVSWAVPLGWAAALSAVEVAYVRVLGGSLGLPQSYIGPMAKPHRMAIAVSGCLVASAESLLGRRPGALAVALLVVVVGSAITFVRRTLLIVRGLR